MKVEHKQFITSYILSTRIAVMTVTLLLMFVSWRLVLLSWAMALVINIFLPKQQIANTELYGEGRLWAYQHPEHEKCTAENIMQKVRASGINTSMS